VPGRTLESGGVSGDLGFASLSVGAHQGRTRSPLASAVAEDLRLTLEQRVALLEARLRRMEVGAEPGHDHP